MPQSQLSISVPLEGARLDCAKEACESKIGARTYNHPLLALGPVERVLRVAVLELDQDDLVVPKVRRVVRPGRSLRALLVRIALLVCVIGALQKAHKSDVLRVLLRSVFQPTAAASPTAVSEDRRVDGWVDGGVGPALPSAPSPSSRRSRKTGACDFCRLGKKRLTPLVCGAPAIETRSTRSLSPASGKKLEWIDVSLNAGILAGGSSRQQVLRSVERRADRQDSLHQSGQRKAKAESSSSSESPAWEHGSWAVTFIPRWSRFGLNSKLGGPHWGGIRFGS